MVLVILFIAVSLLVSPAIGAPTDVIAIRDEPIPKNQVRVDGKTYYYRGCYDELKSSAHALNHNVTDSLAGPVTIESCVTTCSSQGYQIAGLMYGDWCYCDNAMSALAPKLGDQCDSPCGGDSTEACGGVWHYGIYYTKRFFPIPVPEIPTTVGFGADKYRSIGCWKDNVNGRTLEGDYWRSDSMTVAQCASYCHDRNFRIAGVEFGIECFCGQELLNPEFARRGGCDKACGGDSTLACGGEGRIQVYVGLELPDVLRPKVLAGTNLFNHYISIGCYSDSYDLRSLTGYTYEADGMTADDCAAKCFSKGYKYAGLELGTQCFCGGDLSADLKVDASRCDTPCGGDPSHSCGGGLRLDVYKSLTLGWF